MVTVETNSDPGTFQPYWQFSGIDDGQPVRVPQYSDKSYAMWGVWGGTVLLQGSWDKSASPSPDSWLAIYETDNTTAITYTGNAAGVILENPIWIRAKCSAAVINVKVVINCTLSAGAR